MGMAKTLARLKTKRFDALILAILYLVVGAANTYVWAISDFIFAPGAAFAALSFIAAYGVFVTKKWAVWIVTILFFPATTFGVLTLFSSIRFYTFSPSVGVLLFHLLFLLYVILYVISFAYVAVKRKTFQ